MSIKGAGWALLAVALFLNGCATPPPPSLSASTQENAADAWQGRLHVRVQGEAPQAMSANFSLRGDADNGALALYSPLGTTVAALQWSPQAVQLQQSGKTQYFNSLAELTEHATGVALPVSALFQWLHGQPTQVEGWQADLSALAQGVLTAQRSAPLPQVQLRIRLDP